MRLSSATLLVLLSHLHNAQSQGETCSGVITRFPGPSKGACLTSWANSKDEEKQYPADFGGVLSKVEIYQCPDSGKRVMISNGIPDHKVTLQNNNAPCEVNWVVEIPLNPTVALSKTEVPVRGMIAMATNGVPAYGPQESDSNNAVAGNDGVPGARFWYGHTGAQTWHFHNPHMGKETVTSDLLLGYAMDGFPIYGPLDDNAVIQLDSCNGIYNSDGSYQYHVRAIDQVDANLEYCNGSSPETNWNYILGCYAGSVGSTEIFDSTSYTLPSDCFVDGSPNASPVAAPTGQGTKPNIIIMQPDDLQFFDAWTPPPNNPNEIDLKKSFPPSGLPNIESLRLNGLQMMQAYTASPVCGTSRYSTITGKYPSRAASSRAAADKLPHSITIPTTKLVDKGGINDCSNENVAAQFQSNGYSTAMLGKWHLSRINKDTYTYAGAVETVKACGFSKVGGLYIENLAASAGEFNNYSDGSFSHNMEWITYEAVEFINAEAQADKPFFMYFNPTVPHGSNDVGDALKNFSCRDTADGKLGFDPVIPGMTEKYGSCEAYRQSIYDRSNSEEDYGPLWLDDSVGALLTALRDNGILENTIFLFQMDHGMETKSALYENGVRIPQFIHYPAEIIAGTKFDAPVSTIDIGATMMDFAGIVPSYELDGKSWKDAVGDASQELYWKNYRCLFFELENDRAVRCGCQKYLSIYQLSTAVSTTFRRGNQKLLSNDLQNLFDLCGADSSDYVTDPTTNMEGALLNLVSSDQEEATKLSDRLQCHLTRTEYSSIPDFSTCELATSSPTSAPTSAPVASPTSCSDTVNIFHVTRPNGLPISKDCRWVAKKTWRCNLAGVTENCPKTCNNCPSAPTLAPTSAPVASPTSCSDTVNIFQVTRPNGLPISKGCPWVAKKTWRCNLAGVTENCPKTCNNCPSPPTSAPTPASCSDTAGLFQMTSPSGKKVTKGCLWVAKKSTWRCKYTGVMEECAKTCNNCN